MTKPEIADAEGAFRKPKPTGPGGQRERLVSGDAARAQIKQAFDDQSTRREQMRRVSDAYDRIPPDTDAELAADGLNGLANVNWGGMQTAVDDAVEAFISLSLEPSEFCSFESATPHREAGNGLVTLSKELSRLLRRWPSMDDTFGLMCHNMVAHGLGVFYWPMPHSWHFRALHPANLITEKRAQTDPDTWDWCGIITEFSVHDLIAKLATEYHDAATAQGWDLSAVRKAIETMAASGDKKNPEMDVDAIVQGFERGKRFDGAGTISGYIYYLREWSGEISEYWLTDQAEVPPLFQRKGRYQSMSSVVAIFPGGLGDGFLNRLRGYGLNSLAFHDLEDRHLNRMIDASWLASSIGLKGSQDSLNRLSDLIIGPLFTVPEDMDIQQVAFQSNIGQLAEIGAMFDAKKASRNRSMGGSVDVSPGVDRTATGAKLRYQEQTGQRGGAISRFYRRLSRFYQTLWARIADPESTVNDPGHREAAQLLLTVIQKGCPPEVLAGIDSVEAKRLFGDGDPNNLFMALQDLAPFFPRLSAGAQRFFMRQLFSARLRNNAAVEQLIGDPELDDVEQRQRQIAQGENADFQTSDVAIAVASGDNHIIHAGEHLIFAEDTVTQFQNGRVPLEAAFQTLARVREHNLGHLEPLSQDKLAEPVFRDANNRWAAVDNMLKRMQQMLGDKRKAEQEDQLAELRNPRPKVADIEAAQTAQLARQTMLTESQARIVVMREETAAKIGNEAQALRFRQEMERLAASGAIVDQKQIPQAPADR